MYQAKTNSPMTELSSAIDNVQTTIPVSDASALPPAPNLATIGTTDTAETILYAGISGNDLTGVTRGFQGTALSWGTGTKIARYYTSYDHDTFKANIEEITGSPASTPISLTNGQQILTATKAGMLRNFKVLGRTLVNLLGRDGNCEDTSKWSTDAGVSFALDSNNQKYGTNSFKITLSSVTTGAVYQQFTYKANKYYLAVADVKNGNATNVYIRNNGVNGNAITATSYGISYFTHTDTVDFTDYVVISVVGSATGQYAYVDGVRIYEITSSEKTYIDGLSVSAAQTYIASKYPYVDSVQHLSGLYMIRSGENLFSDSTQWSLRSNSVASASYTWYTPAGGNGDFSNIDFTVVPNTDYTITADLTNASHGVYTTDFGTAIQAYTASGSFTFNSGNNTKLSYLMKSANTASDSSIVDMRANIGDTDKGFQPRNDDMMVFPVPIASNYDQSVTDLIYHDGQKYVKESCFKDMVLDGSLTWSYGGTGTGWKYVTLGAIPNSVTHSQTLVKYDGKIIGETAPMTAGDQSDLQSGGNFYVAISSADSGWGDSYTPTADEIKACVAYGWKMYDGGAGLYTSGTKHWIAIDEWGYGTSTDQTTVPATYAPIVGAKEWQPYKLTYQLATPTYDDLTGIMEGEINLLEGANQIEIGAGMILREKVSPHNDGNNVTINNTTYTDSLLKYRTSKFMTIYRSGRDDKSWSILNRAGTYSYGLQDAVESPDKFDPTATYETTYQALDQYQLTSSPVTITGEYDTNIKTVQDRMSQTLADYGERLSVAMMLAQRKYHKPDMSLKDMTYYVDGTNGSDSGDGSASKPFKTIGKFTSLYNNTIVNHTITVNIAAGTYNEDVIISGIMGSGWIYLSGATTLSGAASYQVKSISIKSNSVSKVSVSGVQITGAEPTNNAGIFIFSNSEYTAFSFVENNFNDATKIGFRFQSGAKGDLYQCDVSNKQYAVYSEYDSTVFVSNCTGGTNTNGMYAATSSVISYSGTYPTATNAANNITTNFGGRIDPASGVVGAWGDSTTANRSFVHAGHTVSQSLASGVTTKINFTTLSSDQKSEWASNKFTASQTGIYQVNVQIEFSTVPNGAELYVYLYKNGLNTIAIAHARPAEPTSSWGTAIGSSLLYLSAGDYMEIYANQNSGGSLSTNGDGSHSYFNITKVA
jgi:hypothetical protein